MVFILLWLSLAFQGVFSQSWTFIGVGVHYQPFGSGNNVFIGYAGCTVWDSLSQHWVARLRDKSTLVDQFGVGHFYAVKGPDDCSYLGGEIQNSLLIRHMLDNLEPSYIIVAAHSSGAFVAHEFFHQLYDWGSDSGGQTKNKISYFNMDGGGGLSASARSHLRDIRFVWVQGNNGQESMNAATMRALAGSSTENLQLNGQQSGCLNHRCLHDVVIIEAPWDPYDFDLERDYSWFSVNGREVQFDYLQYIQPWANLSSIPP